VRLAIGLSRQMAQFGLALFFFVSNKFPAGSSPRRSLVLPRLPRAAIAIARSRESLLEAQHRAVVYDPSGTPNKAPLAQGSYPDHLR
jgi:hypothetical protein